MKKLTLLGDSIRLIGYGEKVAELLKDEFIVYQPNDNCRFSKYTLRGVLCEWAGDMADSDIIHWNNGLWDVCDLGDGPFSTKEEYVENMVRVARLLKVKAKTVIFATTTPVRGDHPHNSNALIAEYNAAIVPVLEDMGIIINDLHAVVCSDIEGYIRDDDKIHLTAEGIEVCAKKVAEVINSVK